MEEEAYLKYKYGDGDDKNCLACPFCRSPFLNNPILNKPLQKIVKSYLAQFPENRHEEYKLGGIFNSTPTPDSVSTSTPSSGSSWESTSFYPTNAPANFLGSTVDFKEAKTGAQSRSTVYSTLRSGFNSSLAQHSSSITSRNMPRITTTTTQTFFSSASHSNSSSSSLTYSALSLDEDDDGFVNIGDSGTVHILHPLLLKIYQ